MHGFPHQFAAPRECEHTWEAVSMRFETQILDQDGRVLIRQPDVHVGRCYFICRSCASHTYMTTQWLGVRMYGSEDAVPEDPPMGASGIDRGAWDAAEDDAS